MPHRGSRYNQGITPQVRVRQRVGPTATRQRATPESPDPLPCPYDQTHLGDTSDAIPRTYGAVARQCRSSFNAAGRAGTGCAERPRGERPTICFRVRHLHGTCVYPGCSARRRSGSDRSVAFGRLGSHRSVRSVISSTPGGGEVFVHHPHGHRPFAGRGSDPFDRTAADVAGSEHPAAAGLQR